MTEPNENVQSQLSAFVDNELPQDETQLLARRLSRDSGLQQSLNRYLLIGEALRSPKQTPVSRNLSSRVAAALEQYNEPQGDTAVVVKPFKAKASWAKTALGMSLAASVAAIAMVAFYGMQSPVNGGADSEVAMNDSSNQLSSAPADSYVVPVATTTPSVPISAARLTNYVVAHSEFTSPLGRRNTMTGLVTGDQQTEAVEETVDTAATGTGK
ncbi:MAG TPA: sigma-E factor negative regulatory protein [Steroidobacteraceae bacterium]|nr:sigma-E factor negative regulatory protein [Steroidobacteraceae bacterium]